jgi:hypothetical protein
METRQMKRVLFFVLALALTPACAFAQAQPSQASQDLSACIARATTPADNVVVSRWVFIAMARHPRLADLANIPEAERAQANRQVGAVFNRLLLEACPNETRAALRADGENALEGPFGTLGERAMEEITGNAAVSAGFEEGASYIDVQRLGRLIGQK